MIPDPSSGLHRLDSGHEHVGLLELAHPPYNYLNAPLLAALADTLEAFDADPGVRCIVLAARGRAFSAGADFGGGANDPESLYTQAMRLFRTSKPVVAAVHGAAIGAGLGLALAADFRVTCSQARYSANFNRLGFHPGFGLSVTLPRLLGPQQASLLLYTGRRIDGTEAVRIGLADVLAEEDKVRVHALALAAEIAASAPLAVTSTRATLRAGLADEVQRVNERERKLQLAQFATEDFREGVQAMAERRLPQFRGK
ncbi:enoyl-CoA hydratase/isomerase family protein [Verticiella sediminum]|uniref:Enoyl-CoA hydratase/isomerase family protein n=2 Tax=Verticiella sediminum TaxID=1247510 RepID=A0A556AJU3_9BURK|nr:enoyl-CoA hydratase/isomerase family protein [Verticiella sediminum]